MLKIRIHKSFETERRYIVSVLFAELLGLEYSVSTSDNEYDYLIELPNGKTLTLTECELWKLKSDEESYLSLDNIPKEVSFSKNEFTLEEDIPILFGDGTIDILDSSIRCGVDIFSSSFFMLARWEEHVNTIRDTHERFPAEESLAYKAKIIHRPIVNEYAEMLWNMLLHLGYNKNRKETTYRPIITHDVDVPFLWSNHSPIRCIKEIAKVILRPSKQQFIRAQSAIVSLLDYRKDPYWTFDLLMEISEGHGLKSYFFFMAGGTSDKDNFFKIDSPKIITLIQNIKKKGHYIGFHPSYNSHNDLKQFQYELQKLNEVSGSNIHFGRQHYLRFEVPKTWELWNTANCTWESTMGYAGQIGFRCGVCNPFTAFNFIERKALSVKERPLIAMDCTLFDYMHLNNEEGLKQLEELKQTIKRYNGEFVFLWHNSYFQRPDFTYNRLEFYRAAIDLLVD